MEQRKGCESLEVQVLLLVQYPRVVATGTIPVTVLAYSAPAIMTAGPSTSTEGETSKS
ncbi:MAG: hypothetical protein WCO89_02360 [Syntrophus sp. (in: bacteria)]